MDIGRLTATLAVQQRGFLEAQRAMLNLQKTTLQTINTINARMEVLEANVAELATRMNVAAASTARAGASVGQPVVTSMTAATKSFDGFISKMHQAAMNMRSFGWLATTVFTLPIIAAGKSVLTAYSDFEYSMMKIVGLVGIARNEVESWADSVKGMSQNIGRAPNELADALYYVTSSGYKSAAALGIVEQSAKAAAAGLGETQDIADLVTSVMNAYGQGNIGVTRTLDILTAAVREGKGEASQYAKVLGSVVPFAAQLGVTFDEVAGAVASMTLSGASAANAATYLRNIFMKLLKPAKQSEDALRAMGSSTAELRSILADQGLMPALIKIRELTNKYGEDMLGKVIPNIRAMLAELMITGKNLEYNKQVMDLVSNSSMSMAKAYQAVYDTTKNRLNRANAALKVAMIDLGSTMKDLIIPILEKFVERLSEITKWFNSLDESVQKGIVNFTAFLAVVGPGSLILSVFGLGVTTVAKKIGTMVVQLRAVRAGTLAFSAAMGSIASLSMLAGAGIVAAVVAIARHNKVTREARVENNAFLNTLVSVNGEIKKLRELGQQDYSVMGIDELTKQGRALRQQADYQRALIKYEIQRAGFTEASAEKYTKIILERNKVSKDWWEREIKDAKKVVGKNKWQDILVYADTYEELSKQYVSLSKSYKEFWDTASTPTVEPSGDTKVFNLDTTLALMKEQLRQIDNTEKAYKDLGIKGYEANKERLDTYSDSLAELIDNGYGASDAAKMMAEHIKRLTPLVESSKEKLHQFGLEWEFIESKEKLLGNAFDASTAKLSMYNNMLDQFVERAVEAVRNGEDLAAVTKEFVEQSGTGVFEGMIPEGYEQTLTRIVELIKKYTDLVSSEELQKAIDVLKEQAAAFGDVDIQVELLRKNIQITRSLMNKYAKEFGIASTQFQNAAAMYSEFKQALIDVEAALDASYVKVLATEFGRLGDKMSMLSVATSITESKIRELLTIAEKDRGEAWQKSMAEQIDLLGKLRKEAEKMDIVDDVINGFSTLWDKLSQLAGEADQKWMQFVGDVLNAIPQIIELYRKYAKVIGVTNKAKAVELVIEKAANAAKQTGVVATELNTAAQQANAAASTQSAIASSTDAAASAANAGAKGGEAVASATAEGAKMPFPYSLVAIALGVAAVIAALRTAIPRPAKMATGGIVPEGYPNDTFPALLTSGETVVPKGKANEYAERILKDKQKKKRLVEFSPETEISSILIPKLQHGGEIPPGFPNDSYPAMLSSGETVLPKKLDFTGFAFGFEKMQRDTAGAIRAADTLSERISNFFADMATGMLTWGFQFRRPRAEEIEAGRAGWKERVPLVAEAATYGMLDEMTGKLTSLIPDAARLFKKVPVKAIQMDVQTGAASSYEKTVKELGNIKDIKLARQDAVNQANLWMQDWLEHPATLKRADVLAEEDIAGRFAAGENRYSDWWAIKGMAREPSEYYVDLVQNWMSLSEKTKQTLKTAYGIAGRGIVKEYPNDYLGLVRNNLSPEQTLSTGIHEAGHRLTRGDDLIPQLTRDKLGNVFYPPNMEGVKALSEADPYIEEELSEAFEEGMSSVSKYIDKKIGELKYFGEPTEVYARMFQFRHAAGIKPGETLSRENVDALVTDMLFDVIPNKIDKRFFSLMKDTGQFTDLLNKLPAVAGLTAGGLALSSREAAAKEGDKSKEKYPEVFKIVDQRKVDTITGQPVSPYAKIHGELDFDFVEEVVKKALERGIDPYTALAIPLQEKGKYASQYADPYNTTNVEPHQLVAIYADEIGGSLDVLKDKLKIAERLNLDTFAQAVQVFNGLGTLKPSDFGTSKAYGIDIPAEGISMKQNPLYGKRIEDVRNNIIMRNEELVAFVENLKKQYAAPIYPTALQAAVPTPPEYVQPIATDAVAATDMVTEALRRYTAAMGMTNSAVLAGEEATTNNTLAQSKYASVTSATAQGIGSVVSTAIQGGDVGKAAVGSLGSILPSLLSLIPGVGPILQLLLGGLGGGIFSGIAAKMARGGKVPEGYPNDSYPALLTSGETVLPKEYKDMPDMLASLTRQGSIPSGSISDELQLLLSTYEINFPEEKFKSLIAPLMKRPIVPAEKAIESRRKLTSRIYNVNNYTSNLTKITKDQAIKNSAFTKQLGKLTKGVPEKSFQMPKILSKIKKESNLAFSNNLLKMTKGIQSNDRMLSMLIQAGKNTRGVKIKDRSADQFSQITKVLKESKIKNNVGRITTTGIGNSQVLEKLTKLRRIDDKSLAYLTRISRGTEMTEKLLANADYYPQVARMAGGGQVPSGYPNDSFPAMLSSGEYVLPKNVQRNMRNIEQKPQKIHIELGGKVLGKDLGLILRRITQYQ